MGMQPIPRVSWSRPNERAKADKLKGTYGESFNFQAASPLLDEFAVDVPADAPSGDRELHPVPRGTK